MPCSDPVMSDRDKRCYVVGELLLRFNERGMLAVPNWVTEKRYIWPYAEKLDEGTRLLCLFCKAQGEDFIYNGRDADCRKLADWWDEHKKSPGHIDG